MAVIPCPDRGSIVTYLNPDVLHPTVYVRGVVIGAHVVDPQTSRSWVPVMLPDRTVSVLDTAKIIRTWSFRRTGPGTGSAT
ncbi:hypothetical protein [Saccharothrix yanglingensis]|nr:hypothetical protein [Saccharothrix yanglingensis]